MKLNKWNYITHQYNEVEMPDGNYKTYSEDMDEIVNCPHCYKSITFGSGYTSQVFHTHFGFGYTVCADCHFKEIEEAKKYGRY